MPNCFQVTTFFVIFERFGESFHNTNVFSVECRNAALSSHHKWECKLSLFLERTQLDRLPLIMMAFRAITQKPATFFDQMAKEGVFQTHDIQNGVELEEQVIVAINAEGP